MRARWFVTGLLVAGLMVAAGVWPGQEAAQAVNPAGAPGAGGGPIPYAGRLTDEAGLPVPDGLYDFRFGIYAGPAGGEALWAESRPGVAVKGGAFAVLLGEAVPLPQAALASGRLWLEAGVRGPLDQAYAVLSPRQQIDAGASAAPAVGAACPHDHVGEAWTGAVGWAGSALKVTNALNGPSVWGVNNGGGNGIRGEASSNGIGVYGGAATGPGVLGQSTGGDGVEGASSTYLKSGVYGHTSAYGYGVYGAADGGYGVYGTTAVGDGVHGESTNGYGVYARNPNGAAMYAEGCEGTCAFYDKGDLVLAGEGTIHAGWALDLYSDGHIYLHLDHDGNDANACLQIWDSSSKLVGMTCENGAKMAVVQTETYGQRAIYSIESPEVWLQEFGSAKLIKGEATVPFEAIFAQTIDVKVDYHVQVTPLCQEPVLLFVTAKTAAGFTVKGVGLDGAPSSCAFDYEVAAKRLGLADLRLETVASRGEVGP